MTTRNRRSGVEDRWTRVDGQPSARHGKGLRWMGRYVDDEGREHTKVFPRRVDAKKWVDEQTAALVTGAWISPERGAVTFGAFYADWSERQVWAPSTRQNANETAAGVPFRGTALGEIRRSHIEAWIKAMSEHLAPTTIKTRVVIVRSVFRAAVVDKHIAADPTAGVTLPRTRRREAAMVIPSSDEVGALLRAAPEGFRAFVALCAFAGLRPGEAQGLQVGAVDFLRRRINVERQIQRDGSSGRPATPKWGSERVVFAADELLAELSAHIATHPPAGDGWLFHADGVPWIYSKVAYRWRQTLGAAGLDMQVKSLRHFYASGLIAEGCDVVTVQRAMGHATATTTLSTYAHLWPSAEDRTRAAAGSLARAALESPADCLRTGEHT